MTKAIWNGQIVAESDRCEHVERNAYFPPDSLRRACFRPNDAHSVSPWKGTASDCHLEVAAQRNPDAAFRSGVQIVN